MDEAHFNEQREQRGRKNCRGFDVFSVRGSLLLLPSRVFEYVVTQTASVAINGSQ